MSPTRFLKRLIVLAMIVSTTGFVIELGQAVRKQYLARHDETCHLAELLTGVITSQDVPIGAQHSEEIMWRKTAPDGFDAVLALIQAVSVTPCGTPVDQEAKLSIRAIRLIERNPATGKEQTVSEVNNFLNQNKTIFTAKLFQRTPIWYPPNGSVSDPPEGMTSYDDKILTIDLSRAPQSIYHGWTEPQAEAKPGMMYVVEMEVNLSGLARLQIGIDYWRAVGVPDIGWDGACQKTNHCEGYLSKWYGPTNGWQTIRAPEALMP